MIISRNLYVANDERKTVRLETTFDTGFAAQLAKEVNANGGGRIEDKNAGMHVLGYIPPEMWSYDPWLVQAKRARNAGDMGEYTKLVRKFFEVHKEYQVFTPKKFF